MITRDIRVSTQYLTCEVCGRNLLRGERAERYVVGGESHWVCDLCASRALQDGWVREGTGSPHQPGEKNHEPRRQVLPWLRAFFERLLRDEEADEPEGDLDEYKVYETKRRPEPVRPPEPPVREPSQPQEPGRLRGLRQVREPRRAREPRRVHAVPASPEQKVSSAIRAFNESEYTRTIAGVARALGSPAVTIRPSEAEASVVRVVAAWELCWYRYEVDLADELPSVRVAARGSELDELEPTELESNARADERGALAMRK